MESLDFLWFYGNVFSSRVSDSGSCCRNHVQEEHAIEEVLTPVLQVVEDQKNEPESEAGDLISVTPKCAEVSVSKDHIVELVEYYCPSPRKKEQGRRSPRSKRGLLRNRRRILGELDLDLHVKAEASGGDCVFLEENFGCKRHLNLNDNMAMKEHLKTWAYAVACTVR